MDKYIIIILINFRKNNDYRDYFIFFEINDL